MVQFRGKHSFSTSAAMRTVAPVMQLIRPATTPGLELAKTMPGVTAPFGFFDPLGLCPENEMVSNHS